MKSIFSFFKVEDTRQRQENQYLNSSKSLSDLEHRMRQIDNGLFRENRSIF